MLGSAAAVLALVVGAAIWNNAQGEEPTGDRSSSSSGTTNGSKSAADPESCGGRINVGADQGDEGGCTEKSSSAKSDSSKEESKESEESKKDTSTKTAPMGTLPYALEGVWEGEVSQPAGTTDAWTVRLELKGGKKKAGTMEAVDLGCTSKVTVTNAGNTTATLRAPVKDEDNPSGTCAPLGEVLLLQDLSDPDRAAFHWKDMNNAGNIGMAELERVE